MKIYFLSLVLLLGLYPQTVTAQNQFSYISDCRFVDLKDLVGYGFFPGFIEVPNAKERALEPGEYTFGFSKNNLYVKGEEIAGVYNVQEISDENYGYKAKLVNARDARNQGHLKIILNQYFEAEALIFKKSPDAKELIFYQAVIPSIKQKKEKAYFTDWGQLEIREPDSLWGQTFTPFFRFYQDDLIQERLNIEDNTHITFEVDTLIDKRLKTKKRKYLDENNEEQIAIDSTYKSKTTLIKKIVENSVRLNEEGKKEVYKKEYIITGMVEYVDETAGTSDEKYRWEFKTKDQIEISLFLSKDKKMSSINIGNHRYWVRGF